jgi:hypothetical protein
MDYFIIMGVIAVAVLLFLYLKRKVDAEAYAPADPADPAEVPSGEPIMVPVEEPRFSDGGVEPRMDENIALAAAASMEVSSEAATEVAPKAAKPRKPRSPRKPKTAE